MATQPNPTGHVALSSSLAAGRSVSSAQTPHPAALGSALTHPWITTDYSEALIELITPPTGSIDETLGFLEDLHRFVYAHIGDEQLWVNSMPCLLGEDSDIPLAQYGTSNIGRMKTLYRRGLGVRYGRKMQTFHLTVKPEQLKKILTTIPAKAAPRGSVKAATVRDAKKPASKSMKR